MDIFEAIDQFRDAHPEWSTQRGALHQCDAASHLFVEFLVINMIAHTNEAVAFDFYLDGMPRKNPDPEMYCLGENESGHLRSSWHCIVETKNFFIDWTARQYHQHADFPLIIQKKADAAAASA